MGGGHFFADTHDLPSSRLWRDWCSSAARSFVTVLTFLMSTAAIGTDAEAQSFAVGRSIETPEHPNAVAIGDFNNDGHQDIVIPCYSPNSVSVALADGTGGFGPAVAYEAGGGPRFAAVADFNGDGHADIVVANQDSADVAVLLGTGAGTFAPTRRVPAGLRPFHLAVSDLNNDGSSDILVANSASTLFLSFSATGTGDSRRREACPLGRRRRRWWRPISTWTESLTSPPQITAPTTCGSSTGTAMVRSRGRLSTPLALLHLRWRART